MAKVIMIQGTCSNAGKSLLCAALCRLIDECVSGALDNEVHRTAEMLRERESENVKGAAKLLNIFKN